MSQSGLAFLRLGFPELSLRWQADPSQYPPTYLLHEGIQVKTSGPSSQITQDPKPSKTRPQSSRGGPPVLKAFPEMCSGQGESPSSRPWDHRARGTLRPPPPMQPLLTPFGRSAFCLDQDWKGTEGSLGPDSQPPKASLRTGNDQGQSS